MSVVSYLLLPLSLSKSQRLAFILVVFWVHSIRRLWWKCDEQKKEKSASWGMLLLLTLRAKCSSWIDLVKVFAWGIREKPDRFWDVQQVCASGQTSALLIPVDPGSAFLQFPFRHSIEGLKMGCQVECPQPSCSVQMIDAPLRHVNQVSWSRTDGLIDGIFNREHNRRWVPPLKWCSSFGASICVLRFCLSSQSEPLRRVSLVFSCSRLCEPHNDHSALLVVELLFNAKHCSAATWGRGFLIKTHRRKGWTGRQQLKGEDQLQAGYSRLLKPAPESLHFWLRWCDILV